MALALPFPLLQEWLQEQQGILFQPFSLSLLFFLTLFFLLRLRRSRRLNLPPSPSKLPIIGNLHQLGTLPHRSLRALSKKYGPLMLLHLGQAPTLVVSSAEMAIEIMKTHDIALANRPITTAAKAIFYGCRDVGFAPYGEYWRQMRKICVQELLSVKRVQSLNYVREEEVAVMIKKISPSCSSGATINLSEILISVINNILCRSVLGRKYEEEEGKSKFGELSREVHVHLGAFSFGDFFPSLGWMDVLTRFAENVRALTTTGVNSRAMVGYSRGIRRPETGGAYGKNGEEE
ncbi:hypothetical protein HHK36_029540 [Tetracentron sinense]|uniref:Cytochrome P450 n=1 Tax=Tetracentron sinense TaxID=13715 RepID=A0A834Y9Q3_TETSI|nr:hypothetical protein HHK36_029540 [Tetracentron sinense]